MPESNTSGLSASDVRTCVNGVITTRHGGPSELEAGSTGVLQTHLRLLLLLLLFLLLSKDRDLQRSPGDLC